MNKSVASPTNWPDNKRVKLRKSKIRAIDAGTSYDIAGNLRRLAREIERGEAGKVTDLIYAIRTAESGVNGTQIRAAHLGTGTIERAHHMARVMANRLEA